jgi:hypothetical protein
MTNVAISPSKPLSVPSITKRQRVLSMSNVSLLFLENPVGEKDKGASFSAARSQSNSFN